jgi:hypothetical protein
MDDDAILAEVSQNTAQQGGSHRAKSFPHSFVKRIKVEYPRIVLDYTIPLNAQKAEPLTREVLPFVEFRSTKPSR